MTAFKIITLGCKVNQCESEALERQLSAMGARKIAPDESANLTIINTCTVTGKAAMQSRQAIRRAMRTNGDGRIVVTGCYARTDPEAIRQVNNGLQIIDYITGKDSSGFVPDTKSDTREMIKGDHNNDSTFSPMVVGVGEGRTRPFLKIQDGCNARCSYCIVPLARGKSRSMPFDVVLKNLDRLEKMGYHETVLTGIHLGSYGRDLSPRQTLSDLINCIEKRPTPRRIRLSSVEPRELTDGLIDVISASIKVCHHLHIPLQSGDDNILRRMHRPYTADYFKALVQKVGDRITRLAIGVDILVGFPGETEKAFINTRDLLASLPLAYFHVFPFSARPGTPAAEYPDQVAPEKIKARCQSLRALGNKKKNRFYQSHLGRTITVLVENKRDRETGKLKATTANYIPVFIDGNDSLKNKLIQIKIIRVDENNRVLGIIT